MCVGVSACQSSNPLLKLGLPTTIGIGAAGLAGIIIVAAVVVRHKNRLSKAHAAKTRIAPMKMASGERNEVLLECASSLMMRPGCDGA